MRKATMAQQDDTMDWRARIEGNLQLATAARVRELFSEINPQLVGEKLFEKRWSTERKDAAVLVPLIRRAEGYRVILTVRASDMPSHAGQISFPGGKVDRRVCGKTSSTIIGAYAKMEKKGANV
jgi:hypothetical protein